VSADAKRVGKAHLEAIMSETVQTVEIPENVRAFARARGIEGELPRVLEAAGALHPDISGVRCAHEEDREDEAAAWILVVATGADPDTEQTLATYDAWHEALFALVGPGHVCDFRLELERP
jgi:hypothetical protein